MKNYEAVVTAILFFSILIFGVGVHNIDLAVNFIKLDADGHIDSYDNFIDITASGNVVTYPEAYRTGLFLIIVSFSIVLFIIPSTSIVEEVQYAKNKNMDRGKRSKLGTDYI